MRNSDIRVLHVITGMNAGGAEMMLCKLVSQSHLSHEVVSLTDLGVVAKEINEANVPVRALGMKPGRLDPIAIFRLAKWIRASNPDIVQTWMYHADLVGGIAALIAGHRNVVWGIRHSELVPEHVKGSTIWTARICAALSRFVPTFIVCCAESSMRAHEAFGYAGRKMVVVPNGFNLERYQPNSELRRSFRQELQIDDDTPTVGLVARFDPHKDHHNFLMAAQRLQNRVPNIHFALCGNQVDESNAEIMAMVQSLGIRNYHLLGKRHDVERVMNGIDVLVSSSNGEGFSNAIGEAMACGVPCVVTDAGDSAEIVADTGVVVPKRHPGALASGVYSILTLSESDRKRLGLRARLRVLDRYSLSAIVDQYHELYRRLIPQPCSLDMQRDVIS